MTLEQTLEKLGTQHFQHLVNRVGPITEAELEAKIPEAARIHSREWERTRHPLDGATPTQLHDWAIRHIAGNLVARDRGYTPPEGQYGLPALRVEYDHDLSPSKRTRDDWGQR